jgi:hypothetical protein
MRSTCPFWLLLSAIASACGSDPDCETVTSTQESDVPYEYTIEQLYDIALGTWDVPYFITTSSATVRIERGAGDSVVGSGWNRGGAECAWVQVPVELTVKAEEGQYSYAGPAFISMPLNLIAVRLNGELRAECVAIRYTIPSGREDVELHLCDDETLSSGAGARGEPISTFIGPGRRVAREE